jgi:hypothetical protein
MSEPADFRPTSPTYSPAEAKYQKKQKRLRKKRLAYLEALEEAENRETKLLTKKLLAGEAYRDAYDEWKCCCEQIQRFKEALENLK